MSIASSENFKVVHVDDDFDILEIAKTALEVFAPIHVTSFNSGRTALEQVLAISPDLILLDLSMPDMGGREVLLELKKMRELDDTPIVFLSAQFTPGIKEELLALGAVDVLSKPFDPVTLHEHLMVHLDAVAA